MIGRERLLRLPYDLYRLLARTTKHRRLLMPRQTRGLILRGIARLIRNYHGLPDGRGVEAYFKIVELALKLKHVDVIVSVPRE